MANWDPRVGSARSASRLLKAIFNTAILDDHIVKNPCRVKNGGADRVTNRRIPNVDQVAAPTQSMQSYRAAVTLAAWGTLRRGDVLGLNRHDIDLRAGTVRVERSPHEFYDGRLELGPTRVATHARSTCRVRSCRRSGTTCAASSAASSTSIPRRWSSAPRSRAEEPAPMIATERPSNPLSVECRELCVTSSSGKLSRIGGM
jgi:hypothetical protein